MTPGTDERVRVTFEGGGLVEVMGMEGDCGNRCCRCGKRQVMGRTGRGSKVKEGLLCFALFQQIGGKGSRVIRETGPGDADGTQGHVIVLSTGKACTVWDLQTLVRTQLYHPWRSPVFCQ